MPSTFSTNLKLEMMATGENSATWGTKTNTNLGTLLEEAITGSATVAMADANQTVSISNGSSSTGRQAYLKTTGVLTAQRNLTVPTVNKTYIINNACTGFGVNVTTSGGTGIVVPVGTTRLVYADGTNVVEQVSSTGNLTVSGTLTATGNVTVGSVNKVTITAPATSATLTVADGKTLTASQTVTLDGVSGSTFNLPPGLIMPYAATGTVPTGWLYCDGTNVSRVTFANLFAVVSTTFGVGDGSTTFGLPDMRGRLPAGLDIINGSGNAGRIGSTTLGAALGTATNTATTTISSAGTNAINFGAINLVQTSGAISTTGASVQSGSGAVVAQIGDQVNVTGQTTVNGSFGINVSGSAASSVFNIVQPTMVFSYLIKT